MDIDALLEAFQDFEKKGKKETCALLEQFLCHVAKTGQPLILWSQFKNYFLFKLEKVMDDFQALTPEQRVLRNPNVDYIPFEEMKTRILKIVDGYNGIPFTIQRLCELLVDPKRNYTGTDKFLRGLEKNVMVVSSVYPTDKNGGTSVNRVNGAMFPGRSSLYSHSRNANGPGTTQPLTRPKFSLSTSLSTNGLPECPVSKEPEPEPSAEVEEHHIRDSTLSEGETTPNSGTKNKHVDEEVEEEEEEEDSDADKPEVKRLKFDDKEEDQTEQEDKESSCCQMSTGESLSEMPEPLKDNCGQEQQSGTSSDTSSDHECTNTRTEASEREGDISEMGDVHSPQKKDSAVDQPDSERSTSSDQDHGESSLSDGEDTQPLSSSSSAPDMSTGGADNSTSSGTARDPVEHD